MRNEFNKSMVVVNILEQFFFLVENITSHNALRVPWLQAMHTFFLKTIFAHQLNEHKKTRKKDFNRFA